MSHHDDLLRPIALAYDAAIDTGGWPAFLRDARTVFNAADASLLSHDLVDRRRAFLRQLWTRKLSVPTWNPGASSIRGRAAR
jgi:hypothetical protein